MKIKRVLIEQENGTLINIEDLSSQEYENFIGWVEQLKAFYDSMLNKAAANGETAIEN